MQSLARPCLAVYFASAKQDDKFDVVEEVAKEAGEPPRSSSIAGRDDGSLGTIPDPNGKAI
jgi:hypothetical protein